MHEMYNIQHIYAIHQQVALSCDPLLGQVILFIFCLSSLIGIK